MTFTIIGRTKFANHVFEIEAAYHTDAMNSAYDALRADGFLPGTFTVEFLTNAEAAEFYAEAVTALAA